MERIEKGWYTVERVSEGTTETRYIYDGEYTVIEETSKGKVFEGRFDYRHFGNVGIVRPEWLDEDPNYRRVCPLERFKIIKKC